MSRSPQWTTSWSSTTRTRSLRSPEPDAIRLGETSGTLMRHRQSHPPRTGLALAELDDPADLERLERGQPEAHAGDCARAPAHPVVADLHHPGAVLPSQRHLDARRTRVLSGVAHRLDEHGLRQRLEWGGDVGRVA